jgi:hypothetical protein
MLYKKTFIIMTSFFSFLYGVFGNVVSVPELSSENIKVKEFKGKSTNHQFGCSVGISGNMAIAGADFAGIENEGEVYFFKKDIQNNWNKEETFTGSLANGRFGTSVAISGNYAIAGASGKSIVGNYNENGCVYFYKYSGSNWYKTDTFKGSHENGLGKYVAINGKNAAALEHEGELYIYSLREGQWEKTGTLSPDSNDCFCNDVVFYGNYILIKAKKIGISGINKLYMFKHTEDGWVKINKKLKATVEKLNYPASIAVSENNDLLAIGATSNSLIGNGKVFIYKLEDGNIQLKNTISGEYGRCFGSNIAISNNRLIVYSGSEEIDSFVFNGSKWKNKGSYTGNANNDGAGNTYVDYGNRFGETLAFSDNVLLIGAPSYKLQGAFHTKDVNCGKIYFITKSDENNELYESDQVRYI